MEVETLGSMYIHIYYCLTKKNIYIIKHHSKIILNINKFNCKKLVTVHAYMIT